MGRLCMLEDTLTFPVGAPVAAVGGGRRAHPKRLRFAAQHAQSMDLDAALALAPAPARWLGLCCSGPARSRRSKSWGTLSCAQDVAHWRGASANRFSAVTGGSMEGRGLGRSAAGAGAQGVNGPRAVDQVGGRGTIARLGWPRRTGRKHAPSRPQQKGTHLCRQQGAHAWRHCACSSSSDISPIHPSPTNPSPKRSSHVHGDPASWDHAVLEGGG